MTAPLGVAEPYVQDTYVRRNRALHKDCGLGNYY